MIWTVPCGGYTLYAVEDGTIRVNPGDFFPGAEGIFPDPDGSIAIAVGCYLLTDGGRAVMVDTGLGSGFGGMPATIGGGLDEALALIGISPAEIEIVVHTHLHRDHIGGNLTADGRSRFPNATYFVHRDELDYWLHQETDTAQAVRAVMDGLVGEGRVEQTAGRQEIIPGVSVVESTGHTPGHQSVQVASLGAFALIVGDVTHHPVQIAHPEWSAAADVDPTAAAAVRTEIFDQLAGSGTLMAAGHYPAPGLGYIEGTGANRAFVAAPALQVG